MAARRRAELLPWADAEERFAVPVYSPRALREKGSTGALTGAPGL